MDEKDLINKEYAKRIDYITLFGSDTGQKILNDLISNHCVLSSSFNTDPYRMAFNEGQRNVVLRIVNMIMKDPRELLDRVREIELEMKRISDMGRLANEY